MSSVKATANEVVSDDKKPNGPSKEIVHDSAFGTDVVNIGSQKAATISTQLKITKPSSSTITPVDSTNKLPPAKVTTDKPYESPTEIGHKSASGTDTVNNEPQKAVIIS